MGPVRAAGRVAHISVAFIHTHHFSALPGRPAGTCRREKGERRPGATRATLEGSGPSRAHALRRGRTLRSGHHPEHAGSVGDAEERQAEAPVSVRRVNVRVLLAAAIVIAVWALRHYEPPDIRHCELSEWRETCE